MERQSCSIGPLAFFGPPVGLRAMAHLAWVVLTVGAFGTATSATKLKEACVPKPDDSLDIQLAMQGYDPFRSNPLSHSGNPGFMNGRIFSYQCKDGYRDFISIRSDLNCVASMNTKAYKTVQAYARSQTSTSESELDVEVEASGGGWGFEVEASAQYSESRSSEKSSAYKALESGKGEVFLSGAKCFTHDVSVGRFARSRFTQNFINGLESLSAVLNANDSVQMDVYRAFVYEFGTHYVRKAELGATLKFEKVFQEKSQSEASEEIRKSCMSKAAGGCVGASYSGVVSVSAKACVNKKVKECQQSHHASAEEIEDEVDSITIFSQGSRPKTLETWLESDFKPIPVRVRPEPMATLLTDRNLAASVEYGFAKSLDATALRALFKKHNKKYCTDILKVKPDDCKRKFKGCGQGCACDFGEDCVPVNNTPKGCKCVSYDLCPDKWLVKWRGVGTKREDIGIHPKGACVNKCYHKGANGVSMSNDNNNRCYCEFGMTGGVINNAFITRFVDCALDVTADKCPQKWKSGDGVGGTEVYKGKLTVKECITECTLESGANGLSMKQDGLTRSNCFCEKGMTERNRNTGLKTRLLDCNAAVVPLQPAPTPPPPAPAPVPVPNPPPPIHPGGGGPGCDPDHGGIGNPNCRPWGK